MTTLSESAYLFEFCDELFPLETKQVLGCRVVFQSFHFLSDILVIVLEGVRCKSSS
jgi:hypothetical protein